MSDMAKLVAELLVSDFAQTLKFYAEAFGFKQLYDRPEEAFAYLERYGAQIMIVQHDTGDGRSRIAGELAQPDDRGMNLEIEDVDALHASCVRHGARIFLAMEEKWYRLPAGCAATWGASVYCSGPGQLSPAIVAILGNKIRNWGSVRWMIRALALHEKR